MKNSLKRKIGLIALMLITLLVMSGCASEPTPVEEAPQTEAVESVETEESSEAEATEEVAEEPAEKPVLNIGTLKGPTGMGMIQLMETDEAGTSAIDYNFEVAGAPDQIVGQIVKGNVDIAAVPSNLAAVLDVKTEGKIQLLGVNTLGVLFVMENGEEVQSLEDLSGKTILASGKGASPEYVLNYILEQNSLTDSVTVEYAVEHSEAAAKTVSGESKISMLPQPFVTTTLLGGEKSRIALDLTTEWEKATDGSVLPMGAIIVNKAFAEANPELIATFMQEYKVSVDFVNTNPKEAGMLIEKFGILPKAAIATKAIPNCNITLLNAQEAKPSVQKFLEILHGFNPKSVGGKLPEDSFYYEEN